MTTKPNFKSQDPQLQHVYNTANALKVGSTFNYLGVVHTVTGFTTKKILTDRQSFTPYGFDGYIYYGFLQLL